MTLDTAVIITKGACLTYIPFGTAVAAGLPQLKLTTIFGVPVEIVTLFVAATVAGAGGLLAFISQSFGKYLDQRKGDSAAQAKQAATP